MMISDFEVMLPEDIFKAFAFYSNDENCEVNIKDLKKVLKEGHDAFTEEEIEEIVKHVECDYEGRFNYEMFVNKKLLVD